MKLFYEKDVNIDMIKAKKVAVIGYGSQGYGQANNLKDSGVNVVIGLRAGSRSAEKAKKAGFQVKEIAEAAEWADIIMVLIPDEQQRLVYSKYIRPHLTPGKYLAFSHGLNIHYKMIVPPKGVGVIMIAPKGPGHLVRTEYVKGGGVPCLVAVDPDYNSDGYGLEMALSYAAAIGGTRGGSFVTTFKDETETDLFGEQAVLCGGLVKLIQYGFETLVEDGYAPEMAYFECLHEMKLIIDLMYEGGISAMRYSISNTAQYGDMAVGPKVITPEVKENMKKVLEDVKNGSFVHEFFLDNSIGRPKFNALARIGEEHQIEEVGKQLRSMMAWLGDNKIIDEETN